MNEELAYAGSGVELQLARDPEAIIAEAKRAADMLIKVVGDPKIKAVITIGESQHLKLEAWQTLGHFYALAGRIAKTEDVRFGEVFGFKAYADLIHVPTGKIISSAEAMCLDDEEKWSDRPKYEYAYVLKSGKMPNNPDPMRQRGLSIEDPGKDEIVWEPNPKKAGKKRPKKERVQTGTEAVPTFQLLSMAETRALSKVHSMALRWIVVLAGFSPTPAEEIPHQVDEEEYPYPDNDGPPPPQDPYPQGQNQTGSGPRPPAQNNDGPFATSQQLSELEKLGLAPNQIRSGLTREFMIQIIRACGYQMPSMITQADLPRVRRYIEQGEMPEARK
jgi:hypothetical protein